MFVSLNPSDLHHIQQMYHFYCIIRSLRSMLSLSLSFKSNLPVNIITPTRYLRLMVTMQWQFTSIYHWYPSLFYATLYDLIRVIISWGKEAITAYVLPPDFPLCLIPALPPGFLLSSIISDDSNYHW